jgi:Ca2+-binding RTX toxin-like protein
MPKDVRLRATKERGRSMRRAVLLAVVGSVLLLAFAGTAWADDVFCSSATGERCEGTELSDFIIGTAGRDQVFALGGFDDVFGQSDRDELHGNNGGDFLAGGNNGDTYFGGNGGDLLTEFESLTEEVTTSGPDEMNGGPGEDFMEGNKGADILKGQGGDECGGFQEGEGDVQMFGDPGNDELFGGSGEDCMSGNEGTDEHHGGPDNDFIDAIDGDPETGAPLGTHDLVDCGSGVDIAVVNSDEDIVLDNCENVVDGATTATARVAPPSGTSDQERQQQREAFLAEHGG